MPNLLAFSGSLRDASFNQQLINVAADKARAAGAKVTVVRLQDFDIPLFSEDLEAASGLPTDVITFRTLMRAADGFLIASPEYNGFFTAALKNAIDWASRPNGDEPRLACFQGKTAGLFAASPGALGGIRGLPHLRLLLSGIGTVVAPAQVAVPNAHQVITDGQINDARTQDMIDSTIKQVLQLLG